MNELPFLFIKSFLYFSGQLHYSDHLNGDQSPQLLVLSHLCYSRFMFYDGLWIILLTFLGGKKNSIRREQDGIGVRARGKAGLTLKFF